MYYGERFNSISHLIGVAFSLCSASVLITLAAVKGDSWTIVSSSIYGGMMIFLFGFSTLYHSLQGKAKVFFQKLDYVSIYLMIAGTYTPFTLVSLRHADGWLIFGVIWGLATLGITQELIRNSKTRKLSLFIYVLMGWLILFAIKDLWNTLSPFAFFWLLLGGAFYTIGIIFFVNDTKWKHAHGIWHLFVLAGSICQYFSVVLSIL